MSDNVVSHPAFASRIDSAKLDDLKEAGVIADTSKSIDELDLGELRYGEESLGTLTDQEAALYVAYYDAVQEYDELNRSMVANSFQTVSEAVRSRTEMELMNKQEPMVTPEQAAVFFRAFRKMEYLKNLFFWSICERYDCHDYTVGVRSKRRVVKGARKW